MGMCLGFSPPRFPLFRMDTLTLHTSDGQKLAARCFTPPGGEARQVVVIATALGVPQMFYWDHARWLAQQGCAVITFDWRGMGLSAPKVLKGVSLRIEPGGQIVFVEQLHQPFAVIRPITEIRHHPAPVFGVRDRRAR